MIRKRGLAATRWHRMVTARVAEMNRLQPGSGELGASFWDQRAAEFAAAMAGTAADHPFLAHVRRDVQPRTVVADIGAGSGRFTLALAPEVAEVVAVDQSQGMLALLAEAARREGIDNVSIRRGRWPQVQDVHADVVICSFVIPLIAQIDDFVEALDAAAGRVVHVCMNAVSSDLFDDHLWRFFHGQPRRPAPTYLDAVAVVEQLGFEPRVQIVQRRSLARFRDLADAVDRYRRRLLLADTPEVRGRLQGLLTDWLDQRDDGLAVPFGSVPMAIISWHPSSQRRH